MNRACKIIRPDPEFHSLSPPMNIDALACSIDSVMLDPNISYSDSLATASLILARVPSQDDRISVLEKLGTYPLGPLYFVDDGSGPYATVRDVAAITHNALPEYEMMVKAKFNF